MINKPTVFILGAGSSQPYGFPTGPELRHQIITSFSDQQMGMIHSHPDPGFDQDLELEELRDFLYKFENSGNSIDKFLSRNPSFEKIGKTAIIKTIKVFEHNSQFPTNPKERGDDWYSHIFDLMSEDFQSPDEYFISENKVSFITFNYDRSLEYYLHRCLTNSFSEISDSDKTKINDEFNKIKFIHVYGKLGRLDFEPTDVTSKIPYTSDIQNKTYHEYLENIKIINAERNSTQNDQIKDLISSAERIYIMGFDYARENLDALGFEQIVEFRSNLNIYGTVYKKKKEEINRIKRIFSNIIHSRSGFNFQDKTSLDLLKYAPPE